MKEQKTPLSDFRKRIARGENPYAAAARPMEGGSTVIPSGFITPEFDELRSFLSAHVDPDLEQQLTNLQARSEIGIPSTIGEYKNIDLDVMPPSPGITESGGVAIALHQKNGMNNRILFRPFRLEKYMSLDITSDFGRDMWEGGTYISLSTHGRGYPYSEQMIIGASAEIFSGKGKMSIVHEYDVNQEGQAPASGIELRFYDDSDPRMLRDHRIAEYRRQGDKFVLDERGYWLEGIRKMGVQLPQEIFSDEKRGEIVLHIPTVSGNTEVLEEKRISFPQSLSPSEFIAAVKNGTVDNAILGGFSIS